MAIRNLSFEELLEEKPTLDELCEHILIGGKWYQLGVLLKLSAKKLEDIHKLPDDSTYKTTKMFELWLNTTPDATRKQVIDALRKNVIEEITVAHVYEQTLRKSCSLSASGLDSQSPATEASAILQTHMQILSQYLINPVKVSQLLFSERCITEATLDEMEMMEGILDEKKMTLLSAIHTAVSSDHKKLKAFGTVLSKFEETKMLSERVIAEYVKKFQEDQMIADKVQDVTETCYSSCEDRASDILRCHYGNLSQTLQYPVRVAELLCGERVISETTLSVVKNKQRSQLEEKAIIVLLHAVRHAVHSNYSNLPVFASVLLKFTSNVPCAKAILKDCEKLLPKDAPVEIKANVIGVGEGSPLIPMSTSINSGSSQEEASLKRGLPIPRRLDSVFGSIRKKFAITFSKIREAINESAPPLEKLKRFLADGYSHLKSQIALSNSIDDILDVVNDHCTLININCLEGIVERFDIKEAETHIQAYKNVVQLFCEKTKASLCLDENFKVTKTPSLLQCETAVFVLDWDPTGYTLQDIRDIIAESVEGNVEIRDLREGKSIIITCFFPLSLTRVLIAKAQETLESIKKKGLIQLTIGDYAIYDHRRDKEIIAIVEKKTKEFQSRLEVQHTMTKKMTLQLSSIFRQNEETRQMKEKAINDLTLLLRTKEAIETNLLSESAERQKELETLQEIITSLTLQLRERDQLIEELKQSLKDLAFIPKTRKPLTDEPEDVESDKPGTTGSVRWSSYDNIVRLTRPSLKECEDVMSTLMKEQKTGKEWSIELYSSSPESTAVILNNLNKCIVWRLHTEDTLLDIKCVSILSEILKNNKTLKRLELRSSPLTGGIKQISNGLFSNAILEKLVLYDVTGITDDDMTHLSNMLAVNEALKKLRLLYCNITDSGIQYICQGLTKNQTLTTLDIGGNPRITSISTTTIADLLRTTTSLSRLDLDGNSLNDDDIKTICTSLAKNTTLQKLYLSRRHEENCKTLDSYQVIKDRLKFSYL